MQWYYDKIKDRAKELEKYPGYLPSIVRMCIDLSDWYDFLKEKGLKPLANRSKDIDYVAKYSTVVG